MLCSSRKYITAVANILKTFIDSFVLSLADVDAELLMEEENLVWTSKDVVIVLEHNNEKIPLRYAKFQYRSTDYRQTFSILLWLLIWLRRSKCCCVYSSYFFVAVMSQKQLGGLLFRL